MGTPPAATSPNGMAENKEALRRHFRSIRKATPDGKRRRLDAARQAVALDLLEELGRRLAEEAGRPWQPISVANGRLPGGDDSPSDLTGGTFGHNGFGHTGLTVAIYLSRPPEPDSTNLAAALYRSGWHVIVPSPGRARKPWSQPAWSWYGEPPQIGPRGVPVAPSWSLPAELAVADVIILPGLAGAADGTRLGYGGGWYDRALPDASPDAPRWLLLNDDEFVDSLPVEPHDERVDVIVTPSGAHRCAATPDENEDG